MFNKFKDEKKVFFQFLYFIRCNFDYQHFFSFVQSPTPNRIFFAWCILQILFVELAGHLPRSPLPPKKNIKQPKTGNSTRITFFALLLWRLKLRAENSGGPLHLKLRRFFSMLTNHWLDSFLWETVSSFEKHVILNYFFLLYICLCLFILIIWMDGWIDR